MFIIILKGQWRKDKPCRRTKIIGGAKNVSGGPKISGEKLKKRSPRKTVVDRSSAGGAKSKWSRGGAKLPPAGGAQGQRFASGV